MVDTTHPVRIAQPVMVTQSRTSWGLELGRHCFRVTRTREAHTVGNPVPNRGDQARTKLTWSIAAGTFASVSAFGLIVMGAGASEPISWHPRYTVSVPVPASSVTPRLHVPKRSPAKARVTLPPGGPSFSYATGLSGTRFDPQDEPHVVRAMLSGELQEWTGANGQRRFLNAGPIQTEGSMLCRDLALLVRHADGGSQARNARRCTTGRSIQASAGSASNPARMASEEGEQDGNLVSTPDQVHAGTIDPTAAFIRDQ